MKVRIADTKALAHFKKVDPILYRIVVSLVKLQDLPNRHGEDYFIDLIDAIISQQLSGRAASTIFERFKLLFKDGKITPSAVLKIKDEKIRSAGISYPKIKYIKDLSEKIVNGELELKTLDKMADEKIIEELIQVKGIGKWTAEMFLIFTLGRPNVFSHGDLGLNNAIKKHYKLREYSQAEVEKIVSQWSPYKSLASRALWSSLNNR